MEEAQKKRAVKKVALISQYQNVFNSREGQVVLYDLMHEHGMLNAMFPQSGNANELIYREGARSVILRILTLLDTDPKQLLERIAQNDSAND